MKKQLLWLLLSLTAFPAYADWLDSTIGDVRRTPLPLRMQNESQCAYSLGAGFQALQTDNSPAYCNIAIGYQSMAGKKGAITGYNNIAIGHSTLNQITTGHDNVCIVATGTTVAGACNALTTGFNNVMLGEGAGAKYSTGHDNIVLEFEGVGSGFGATTNNNVLIDGHGGWSGSNTTMLALDGGYNALFACTNVTLLDYSAGRTNLCAGAIESNIIVGGAGGTGAAPNSNDVATSTSNTVLSLGGALSAVNGSHAGTFDTCVGFSCLKSNAQDSAKQAAMGYQSLFTSNVASAQNTAYGYQAGKLISTGTNNTVFGYLAGATNVTTAGSNIVIGASADVSAAAASGQLDIGNLAYGHLAGTAAPTVSACGTTPNGSVDANANNSSGTITIGGGTVTACTITFASAYTTWNHCRVTPQGSITALTYTVTTATITLGSGTTMNGINLDYVCDGY